MSRGRQLTNVTLKRTKCQTYDGQIYAEDGDAVDSGQKGAFLLRVDFFFPFPYFLIYYCPHVWTIRPRYISL
jgi:hypothetical protein